MNNDDDRWVLAVSIGIISLVVGATVLYDVVDDDPQAGVMLVLGSFIVAMGVTLVIDELRRWSRRRGRGRREQ